MLPDNWAENLIPDDSAKQCNKCQMKFSFINRKVFFKNDLHFDPFKKRLNYLLKATLSILWINFL